MPATLPRSRPHNLPAEVTSFVGRRRELAEIKQLLGTTRLLTLTAVGGGGKSRLALRAGSELVRAFPDGVWVVELAALDDPALVAHAVAAAVGLRDQSSGWPLAVLAEHLAGRRLLLILDNCEHLLDACAVMADALLRACPDLHILATSRQPLGIGGEVALRIPPLAIATEAVQLFTERAAAALPGFELNAGTAPAVVELCRRLDGIPLAIELAAVRLAALDLEELAHRLETSFALLSGGSRAALPRQQTLRATIDWSYRLLEPAEATLARRLAVFAGGFDLESAERVCAGGEIGGEAVLELLAALVDQSLVTREPEASPARYRLPETIRQYLREKLRESGEEPEHRRRHRDRFAELSAEAYREWRGARQVEWLERFEAERHNLWAALDFCRSPEEAEAGLEMAADLWLYWYARGRLTEGPRWFTDLLALQAQPSRGRGRALSNRGYLAMAQGETDAASADLEEGRAMLARLQDPVALAEAMVLVGLLRRNQGAIEAAIALQTEALELYRAAGDRAGAAVALANLAEVTSDTGDLARAIALQKESLAIKEAIGDRWNQGFSLFQLGLLHWRRGESALAQQFLQRCLAVRADLDDRRGIATSLESLAWLAAESGRYQRAARLLGAARGLWESIPARLSPALLGFQSAAAEATRSHLQADALDQELERGRRMGLHDAVHYGLEQRPEPAAAPLHPEKRLPVGGLTRREAEIAELVASGLSNKEIAGRLVPPRPTWPTSWRSSASTPAPRSRPGRLRTAPRRSRVRSRNYVSRSGYLPRSGAARRPTLSSL